MLQHYCCRVTYPRVGLPASSRSAHQSGDWWGLRPLGGRLTSSPCRRRRV